MRFQDGTGVEPRAGPGGEDVDPTRVKLKAIPLYSPTAAGHVCTHLLR